jgi:hypothetical protein
VPTARQSHHETMRPAEPVAQPLPRSQHGDPHVGENPDGASGVRATKCPFATGHGLRRLLKLDSSGGRLRTIRIAGRQQKAELPPRMSAGQAWFKDAGSSNMPFGQPSDSRNDGMLRSAKPAEHIVPRRCLERIVWKGVFGEGVSGAVRGGPL